MNRPGKLAALTALVVCVFAASPAGAQEEGEILGKRSSLVPRERSETIAVRAGSRIHAEPAPEAPILATVSTNVELEAVRREGDWAEVRYRSWQGWIFVGESGARKSLLDRPGWVIETDEDGTRRFVAAPELAPQIVEARLERLREILGKRERELDFGPFTLYTDVLDDGLIEQLRATAGALDATYRSRYGLEFADAQAQSVVLFAREETYRSYERELPEISDLATLGHQSHGVAVTFVGERSLAQVRRILLHELTHLLNRRALPHLLPTWLEEGVAEDIAFSRLDEQGRILEGTIQGESERTLRGNRVSGGFASLAALLHHHEQPSWPSVTALVDADREVFVQPESRPTYYTQAAFFIRFLLDGPDRSLAEGLRGYLRELAGAQRLERASRADLWAYLGAPKHEIEAAYDAWIVNKGLAHGVVSSSR